MVLLQLFLITIYGTHNGIVAAVLITLHGTDNGIVAAVFNYYSWHT
jgi:predicted amino acid-binding ACT domain protein